MYTLLYIDDTEADIELLRTLLSQLNIQVEEARTGARGVSAYDPTKHSAVVIDWNLPDMEGMEVAEALLKKYPGCPIAFISGLFEAEHIIAIRTLGIGDCFEKQVNMEHIGRISNFIYQSAGRAVRQAV